MFFFIPMLMLLHISYQFALGLKKYIYLSYDFTKTEPIDIPRKQRPCKSKKDSIILFSFHI